MSDMKRALLFFLPGLLWCAAASAADFATEAVDATYKLFHPASTATCFFMKRGEPDKALYLVTAGHVLEHTQGDTAIVVLRERREDGSYRRRDHTVAVRRDGKSLWIRHDKEDVAVLRLSEPMPVPAAAFPMSALADEARLKAERVRICSPVFVLTYPARFEANGAGFAVARQGIVASHPLLPVERQHTYLVNFTTFEGDSGAPVFVRDAKDHPLIVGMVVANIRYDEKLASSYEERMIHHPLGLGTVLHAQFVRDLVEQAARAE